MSSVRIWPSRPSQKPPLEGGFLLCGWSVRTYRSAVRSKAEFCKKQNLHHPREAHPAWRFQRNLNLAVPTILKKPPCKGRLFYCPDRPVRTLSHRGTFDCRVLWNTKLSLHPRSADCRDGAQRSQSLLFHEIGWKQDSRSFYFPRCS